MAQPPLPQNQAFAARNDQAMQRQRTQKPGNLLQDDYTYTTAPILALAAGASATTSIQIEADSNFEILKRMAFFSTLAADTNIFTAPQLTVQITDTGSGRNLLNVATPIANVFGTAEMPFILQQTKIFSARSVIQITVANISTVTTYAYIQLSFSGRKLFL